MQTYCKSGEESLTLTCPIDHQDTWVYLEAPETSEARAIAKTLGAKEELVLDALDLYEAPRFEVDHHATYIFLRYAGESDEAGTWPLLVAVTKSGVLTITPNEARFLKAFAESGDYDTADPMHLLIKILQTVTSHYRHSLINIQRAVNRRKQLIGKMRSEHIIELTDYEGTVNDFMDALIPQGVALGKLAHGKSGVLTAKNQDLLNDVILATAELVELGRSTLKTMENTREAYSVIATHRLNNTMRFLTALTIIVTVPNMVTGFYGMNLALPFAGPGAAYGVLAFVVLFFIAAAIVLSRHKWL